MIDWIPLEVEKPPVRLEVEKPPVIEEWILAKLKHPDIWECPYLPVKHNSPDLFEDDSGDEISLKCFTHWAYINEPEEETK